MSDVSRQVCLSLISVAAIFGCSEAIQTDSCRDLCLPTQMCMSGLCLDPCLENGICADVRQTCHEGYCYDSGDIACTPSTRRCNDDGTGVLICGETGYFTDEEWCAVGQVCEGGFCISQACEDGKKRCNGSDIEQCRNGSFITFTQCEPPYICNRTSYTCEEPAPLCTENQKRCMSGDVEICTDGEWVGYRNCPQLSPCQEATLDCKETVCVDGNKECTDSGYRICENGEWQQRPCPQNTQCVNGVCSATTVKPTECTNGTVRCYSYDGQESVQTCQGGEYRDTEVCESTQVCNATTKRCEGSVTSKCESGESVCEDTTYKVCQNGAWTATDCATSGQLCDTSKDGCYEAESTVVSHVQNFEKMDYSQGYGNTFEISDEKDGNITISVTGRTDGFGVLIEGQRTVVLTNNSKYDNQVVVSGIRNGIKNVSFQYLPHDDNIKYVLILGEDTDSNTNREEVVFKKLSSNEAATYTSSLKVSGKTTLTIRPNEQSDSNKGRLRIDTLRWEDN